MKIKSLFLWSHYKSISGRMTIIRNYTKRKFYLGFLILLPARIGF